MLALWLFAVFATRSRAHTAVIYLRVAFDRSLDVDGVAVAGVSVPDARDVVQGGADVGGRGQHLRV